MAGDGRAGGSRRSGGELCTGKAEREVWAPPREGGSQRTFTAGTWRIWSAMKSTTFARSKTKVPLNWFSVVGRPTGTNESRRNGGTKGGGRHPGRSQAARPSCLQRASLLGACEARQIEAALRDDSRPEASLLRAAGCVVAPGGARREAAESPRERSDEKTSASCGRSKAARGTGAPLEWVKSRSR